MYFKLPNYSDLTDQQREMLNLLPDDNAVIQGSPGTGKTVLAIYKAKNMVAQGRKVLLLVFNKPLQQYMNSAIRKNQILLEMDTWHHWLKQFYILNLGCEPPQYSQFNYKWDEIQATFATIRDTTGIVYDHVIIDEGQDIPINLYQCLLLIAKNITCLIDPDQKLFANGAEMKQILHTLKKIAPLTLKENFRNPKEIVAFASLYKGTEINASHEYGEKPYMIHYEDYDDQLGKIYSLIRRNYQLNSIGILASVENAGKVFQYLKSRKDDSFNLYPYFGKTKKLLFEENEKTNVYILSLNCMKGLEFDAVILPEYDSLFLTISERIARNQMYVAITRSTGKIYCFYNKKSNAAFKQINGHEDVLTWG